MERSYGIPNPPTPFFGRTTELREIRALVGEPDCRLLTLTGPGGMGKTRLAMELVRAVVGDFRDGVFFIDLQSLPSGDLLPFTISETLGITPGQENTLHHLVQYLNGRQILIVLDNFEHLLENGGILSNLLQNAPQVKLVVTSREALNLQEEWLYPVAGMDRPEEMTGDPNWHEYAQSTSAVQLFAACARRVRPDFSLDAELEPVVEICRLVEGMPLAIELAASWTRMLRCEIIAREIKGNIRFLASSLRNIPERHRSILAVFESTWRMLSTEEQSTFQKLSVFRGGFDQAAAQQIAQAGLPVMLALIDKSLLRRVSNHHGETTGERFGLHDLLRQFAQDFLARDGAGQQQTFERHAAYYLDFLQQQNGDLLGGRQQAAVRAIQGELDNIRVAWKWAASNGRVLLLRKSVQPLDSYFQFQSRFLEGDGLFEQTIQELEGHPYSETRIHTQAQLWVCLGWYGIRLGRFEQAAAAMDTAQTLYRDLRTPPPDQLGSDPLAGQAILAILRGEYPDAVALGEQLEQNSAARSAPHNLAFAHYVLAGAWLAQGNYEQARQHAQEACNRAKALKDEWLLAYGLNEWGHSLCALGETARARKLYQESYQIRQSFNDPEGMALALNHLGKVALLEENFTEAQQFYQESYAIYATIFDRGGFATALNGLGCCALGLKRLADARKSLGQALQVAHEIQFVPLTISILNSIAELFIQAGQRERGLELLHFSYAYPAGNHETHRQAAEKIARYQNQPPGRINSITAAQVNLETTVKEVLAEIMALPVDAWKETANPKDSNPAELVTVTGKNVLVDPLTNREIEILRCMNDGLSNQSIAEQLVLSLGTVKWYTSQIYAKLQVSSRTQAIARAREMGIL